MTVIAARSVFEKGPLRKRGKKKTGISDAVGTPIALCHHPSDVPGIVAVGGAQMFADDERPKES